VRRGTTPTIRVTTSIDISGFSRIVVTLKGDAEVDIEKDRLTFDGDNAKRFWFTLTQRETIDLGPVAEVQIRVVSAEGMARASDIGKLRFGRILKRGVLHA